ncbi:MAG: hypothetical protein WCP21_11510 [Armatimonadota bacterium]
MESIIGMNFGLGRERARTSLDVRSAREPLSVNNLVTQNTQRHYREKAILLHVDRLRARQHWDARVQRGHEWDYTTRRRKAGTWSAGEIVLRRR